MLNGVLHPLAHLRAPLLENVLYFIKIYLYLAENADVLLYILVLWLGLTKWVTQFEIF